MRAFAKAASLVLAVISVPSAARAEVALLGDSGFEVTLTADVAADRSEVWKALVAPARWWSSEHTWSGNADNLYIDSQATGCFCEKLPKPADAPADQRMGSVEHMHIVYADPQTGMLRLRGGLGPLQSEPIVGIWTIQLKPMTGGGTRIEWTYVVGGLLRMKSSEIAPMVDQVLNQQLTRLAALFGPTADPAAKAGA